MRSLNDYELGFSDWLKEYHLGKEQAITAKQMNHWGNKREIRYLVHELRLEGHPICSGQRGYYYAKTSDELAVTVKFLKGIVYETAKAMEGLRDTYYEMKTDEIIGRGE